MRVHDLPGKNWKRETCFVVSFFLRLRKRSKPDEGANNEERHAFPRLFFHFDNGETRKQVDSLSLSLFFLYCFDLRRCSRLRKMRDEVGERTWTLLGSKSERARTTDYRERTGACLIHGGSGVDSCYLSRSGHRKSHSAAEPKSIV